MTWKQWIVSALIRLAQTLGTELIEQVTHREEAPATAPAAAPIPVTSTRPRRARPATAAAKSR